jgi:hypothetical protein
MTRARSRPAGQRSGRAARMGVAVLGAGLLAAACSSSSSSPTTTGAAPSTTATAGSGGHLAPAGGSGAALNDVVSGIDKSATASFSATYTTADAKTGQSQTVTFAQAPPKSAVITSNGSFYIDGKSVTECAGASPSPSPSPSAGAGAKCESLSTSLSASLAGITDLYAPGVLSRTLKGIESEASAHVAGISVSSGSANYGGLRSTCATLKNAGQASSVTYCVADTSGILTYSSANGSTVTLTAFTANPPASTYSPPAGSTVATLPAGT